MKLLDEWKYIVSKAWSFRLILLSGALTGIDVLMPSLTGQLPDRTFAILSALVACAAAIARVLAQPVATDASKTP